MSVNEIIEILKARRYGQKIPSGISCSFLRLDDTKGIKVFLNKRVRDTTYKNQKFLHSKELAPAVYGLLDLPVEHVPHRLNARLASYRRTQPYRCYLTQVARSFTGNPNPIKKALMGLGYGTWDVHYDNLGMVDGKPVVIDCDPVSLGRRRKCVE